MNDIRDEEQSNTMSYQKGKKAFDRGAGFKTINFDGNVSSIDSSVCGRGRVSDRMKFFEQLSSSQSPVKTPPTSRYSVEPSIVEERTDFESYSRNKEHKIHKEKKDSANIIQDKCERTGPVEPLLPTKFHQKWEPEVDPSWDIEPNDSEWETPKVVFEQESYPARRTQSSNSRPTVQETYPARRTQSSNSRPTVQESYPARRTQSSNSRPTVKFVKKDANVRDAENKEMKVDEEKPQAGNEEDAGVRKTSNGEKTGNENDSTKNQPKRPIVMIRITSKKPTNHSADGDDESTVVEQEFPMHGPNTVENTITDQDIDELTEAFNFGDSRERSNLSNYICPSESTDNSVDSEGNVKTPKNASSKSAQKLKGKSNGMGRMLRTAKKGMGKSMKNFTFIVRNSLRTKPPKQSRSLYGLSGGVVLAKKNATEMSDIFDEKFAKELVKDCRDEAGIVMASQYLDSGNKLLRTVVDDEIGTNPKALKEANRKAHTYAYVGRQLAKEYLKTCHEEQSKRSEINLGNSAVLDDNEELNLFDEFFYSFIQCFGHFVRDDGVERTKVQITDALELLTKLSEEESTVVKSRLPKEGKDDILVNRKKKVQGTIAGTRDSADRDHILAMDDADRERSFVIQSFVAALRAFYEIDDTLKLSNIFLAFEDDNSDASSESSGSYVEDSLTYNYSESLKFDHGCGFQTRSIGSPKANHGITPDATVIKISVDDKNSKQKKQQSSKQSSKKWKTAGGRKQK